MKNFLFIFFIIGNLYAGDDVGNGGLNYFPDFEIKLSSKNESWKTLNKMGNDICKGYGFIRKFSDGTNDWTKTNRLRVNVRGFACLNYQDSTIFKRPFLVNRNNYNKERSLMCFKSWV